MPQYESAIGLDIGRHSVKVVRAVKGLRGVRFSRAEMVRLPQATEGREEIIRRFLETRRLLANPCAISVPGESVILHAVPVPRDDPRRLSQVAAMEISNFSDLAEEPMIHDFVRLPESIGHRGILLAMCRVETVQEALSVPDAVELRAVRVLPHSAALLNGAWPRQAGARDVVACADLGSDATQVAVGARHGLLFSRRFEVGSQSFTRAISEAAGVSLSEAEDLKVRGGFGPLDTAGEGAPGRSVAKALAGAADAWLDELRAALSVYRERFPRDQDRPRYLVLTGGGSELAGLRDYVRRRIDLEIAEVDPRYRCGHEAAAERFAVAAGLALAALGRDRVGIDLMPPARKQALAFRYQKPFLAGTGAAAALTLALLVAGSYAELRRAERHLREADRRLERVRGMAAELQELEAENARLYDRLLVAHRGERDGIVLRAIMVALTEARDTNDWVVLVADSKSYFGEAEAAVESARESRAARPQDTQPPGLESVIVEGYTPREDYSSVRAMIERLRDVPYLGGVDLLTDDRVARDAAREGLWSSLGARRFAVEIQIREP